MGKVIFIWSPFKGIGRSTFAYMLAQRLCHMYTSKKVSLLCLNMTYSAEEYFSGHICRHISEIINVMAMDTLYTKSGSLFSTKDGLSIYTSRGTSPRWLEENFNLYGSMLSYIKEASDIFIIDLPPGRNKSLTYPVAGLCGEMLCFVPQDIEQIKRKNLLFPEGFEKEDIRYVIGKYCEIYPDWRKLKNLFNFEAAFPLHFCSKFQDMKNNNQLDSYINIDTKFNREIENFAKQCFMEK